MKVQVTMTETITQTYIEVVEMTSAQYKRFQNNKESHRESRDLIHDCQRDVEAGHEETTQTISDLQIVGA
jgi:hypothetical protein